MSTRLIANPARVYAFVRQYLPLQPVGGMKGIGLEKDGELVAGALYEGYNGHNVWAHLASAPGGQWLNRDFLRYGFHYPFNEMGVRRISGYVEARNTASRRLSEHAGFREEARLQGAASDGGDVILYVMWRDDCRFLKD